MKFKGKAKNLASHIQEDYSRLNSLFVMKEEAKINDY